MKTVTDVNTVNQLLTYSKQAEAGIHQKAIQMLLGAGNNKKQDSLSISDAARGFSKQSIAALIDKNANIIFLTVNWLIILQTIIIQVLFWMQSILGRMFPVDIILILRSTGLFPLTLMGADR